MDTVSVPFSAATALGDVLDGAEPADVIMIAANDPLAHIHHLYSGFYTSLTFYWDRSRDVLQIYQPTSKEHETTKNVLYYRPHVKRWSTLTHDACVKPNKASPLVPPIPIQTIEDVRLIHLLWSGYCLTAILDALD